MVWRESLFTLLMRQVRAGILLYAMLMAAIFALLLQFYLGRVVASERQHQAQLKHAQAYLMAEISRIMLKILQVNVILIKVLSATNVKMRC